MGETVGPWDLFGEVPFQCDECACTRAPMDECVEVTFPSAGCRVAARNVVGVEYLTPFPHSSLGRREVSGSRTRSDAIVVWHG